MFADSLSKKKTEFLNQGWKDRDRMLNSTLYDVTCQNILFVMSYRCKSKKINVPGSKQLSKVGKFITRLNTVDPLCLNSNFGIIYFVM